MTTILDEIVEKKRADLIIKKNILSAKHLEEKVINKLKINRSKISFCEAINNSENTNIIAEIKRVSPSKGPLRPDLDPINLAMSYEQSGACAVSVLTEEHFFKGSDHDLQEVNKKLRIPLLRKDFTIDEYQIWEAKLIGADAILLIASILSEEELVKFSTLAKSLELDILLEVHNEAELEKALVAKPQILGVNNRNLKTFEVNLQTSFNLISKYKTCNTAAWVSESGIYEREQIDDLSTAGFKAFLIGESLLKHKNPAEKLKELVG
ncbi:MAG: indole-3-glycerol phosphate synthase TrpC [Candidatus Caenarcaniphilales bacterium]|nr:indole-3-glycerol phosphate synthase TrpC [Candidatus Caenarcaniphilales bacterium]